MNVGILSAGTGRGHISVALSIKDVLEERGARVSLFENFYEELMFSNKVMSDYYNFLLQTSTDLCSKFSELSYLTRPDLSEDFYKGTKDKITEFLQDSKYDILISTSHTINYTMIRIIRELQLEKSLKYYIVVTDPFYPISVGFDVKGANGYFCTGKRVADFLRKQGIEEERIIEIAYPVHPRFLRKFKESEIDYLREQAGLKKNLPTILINSGSQGAYHYLKLLKSAVDNYNNIQIIFISGKNETLYMMASKVAEKNDNRVKVYGFTDKMEELIQISDIVVTKPGANAFFECVYTQKPILIDGISGFLFQEKGVSEWLHIYYGSTVFNSLDDFQVQLGELIERSERGYVPTMLHADLPGGAASIVDNIYKRYYSNNNNVSAL